jgi:hypothetical protein
MPGTPHMTELTPTWDLGPPFDPPDIVKLMVQWFFENFEDPGECMPWDEGAYMFVWGGPFNAREELEDVFGDVVNDEALGKAVAKIEERGWEWAPHSSRMQPETE